MSGLRRISIVLIAWLVLGCTAAPAAAPPANPAPAPPAASGGAPAASSQPSAAGAAGSQAAGASGASSGQSSASAPASAGGRIVAQPVDPPQRVRVATIGIAAEAPIYLA